MGVVKKHKRAKRIIATTEQDNLVIALTQKEQEVRALERKLAGVNEQPWYLITYKSGESLIELEMKLEQALKEYKILDAAYKTHLPKKSDIPHSKRYFYTEVGTPMIRALIGRGIPEHNATYVVSQILAEQGTIPDTEDKLKIWNANNFFNIKEFGNNPFVTITTHEQDKNGVATKQPGNFKVYNDMDTAIGGYLSLFKRQHPDAYKSLLSPDADIAAFAASLHTGEQGGYGTDKKYVTKLTNTYNSVVKDLPKYTDTDQVYINNMIAQRSKPKVVQQNNEAYDHFDFIDHGIPGDRDFRPSFLNRDQYNFNYTSGKWEAKARHNNKVITAPGMPSFQSYFMGEQRGIYNIKIEQAQHQKIQAKHIHKKKADTTNAGAQASKLLQSAADAHH